MGGFARTLDCALGVIARSRGIAELPHTVRTIRQEGHTDIPARTRRQWMIGRVVIRERPVVVLLATHKIARERQNICESDFKLDLFAPQSRRDR
jgi:hypothetical protein